MSKPVRVAVVGCGVIGKTHLKKIAANPQIELSAVCDLDRETLAKVGEEYQPGAVFDSTEELLEKGTFDAAILALPTAWRKDLTEALIEKGTHLLIEKPVAMNMADLEGFASKVKPGQVVAGCSSRFSNSKAHQQGREWIEQGLIGEIRMLRCRGILAAKPISEAPQPHWRIRKEINGGGILSNWGVYDLDFILSLAGWNFRPDKFLGRALSPPPDAGGFHIPESNVETHAICFAESTDGILLHYERAEAYPGENNSTWEILGSKGSIEINMIDPASGITRFTLDPETGFEKETLTFEEDKGYDFHAAPLNNFISAILGKASILTDLDKSAQITRIIDKIYESTEL